MQILPYMKTALFATSKQGRLLFIFPFCATFNRGWLLIKAVYIQKNTVSNIVNYAERKKFFAFLLRLRLRLHATSFCPKRKN